MSAEELIRTLNELHAELAVSPELDEGTRRSVRAVLDDIQGALDRAAVMDEVNDGNNETTAGSISSRVQELIEDFEVKHPRITLTLSQIADRLADMGI